MLVTCQGERPQQSLAVNDEAALEPAAEGAAEVVDEEEAAEPGVQTIRYREGVGAPLTWRPDTLYVIGDILAPDDAYTFHDVPRTADGLGISTWIHARRR